MLKRGFRIFLLAIAGLGLCLAYPVYRAWETGFFDAPRPNIKFEFDIKLQTGIRDRLPVATEQQLLALPGLAPRPANRIAPIVREGVGHVLDTHWDYLMAEWSNAGLRELAPPAVTTAMDQAERHVFECLRTFERADDIKKAGTVFIMLKVQKHENDGAVRDARMSASDFDDRVINACVLVGLARTTFPTPPSVASWYPLVFPWRIYPAEEWKTRLQRMEYIQRITRDAASD